MNTEHTFLVAFTISLEGDRRDAEARLIDLLDEGEVTDGVDCWWIAEDDRTDNSDTDSAVFVTPSCQLDAARALEVAGLASAASNQFVGRTMICPDCGDFEVTVGLGECTGCAEAAE